MATIAISLFANVAHADLTTGLTHEWTMNEGYGVIARDAIGINDGVLTGGCTWDTGMYGAGVNFSGTDSVVAMLGIDLPFNSAYTISGWFIVSDSNQHWLYSSEDSTWCVRLDAGTLDYWASGAGLDWNPNVAIPVGSWFNLALIFNGTDKFIYINGVMSATTTQGSDDTTGLYVGRYGAHTNNELIGLADEIRIYSRVLNVLEIGDLMFLDSADTSDVIPTTEQDVNWMAFIVLLSFSFLNVFLIVAPRVYILNIVVAILTLGFAGATINDSTLPIQPYFSLIVMLISVLGMWRAASLIRSG